MHVGNCELFLAIQMCTDYIFHTISLHILSIYLYVYMLHVFTIGAFTGLRSFSLVSSSVLIPTRAGTTSDSAEGIF